MNENELSAAEIGRLQKYLPAHLVDALTASRTDPPTRLRSQVVTHLAGLLEATTSHLPGSLVNQLGHTPVAGQADGRFVAGTLLFADISGFTAMSEQLSRMGREGAEEVTAVVNRYFDVMLTILEAYKGELIRFGGDALVGLFEEGHGRYSSATQAVQAAMKMQQAMAQFAETATSQGVFPLQMSVGVHKGRFFAAQLGTAEAMEYAFFGADVNATAAIESAAQAGQVLLDQATYDEIDTDLLCTAVPVPGSAAYLAVTHIDLPPLPPPQVPMDTHFPLPPSLARIRRLQQHLDAFTPYLPVGLLPRLTSDPRAPSLKGEHRLVANLFANVDGLGEIVDSFGPGYEGEIVNALNLYFTRISAALHPYGGVVNKIDLYDHGDKLMVIFGAPIAHEDDAERAVRAAIAMQHTVDELAATLPQAAGLPDLQLRQRIGLSYGYVFAGFVGSSWRHEYTVMGDEVNLAARLMAAAHTGQVIVSEHVQRRVQTVAQFNPRGDVHLKGKRDPIPIFEVEQLRAYPTPVRGVHGMRSPLVGRQDEQERLMADMAQLARGHGRIVSIIGEAGVGKTRLVRDLMEASSGPDTGTAVRWISGRCLSYTESVSYAPFLEIGHQLVGLTHDENAGLARQQIRQAMGEWLQPAEVEFQLPFIANFLNVPLDEPLQEKIRPLDGEALQRRTYVALRTLISAHALAQPLIILIDDIHWMDRASLDLLNYLMPLVGQLPLMFIWLFRPDREKGCWELRRHAREELADRYYEIGLYGLNTLETQQMLMNLVPVKEWPAGVSDLILNRVEGNPLYLEEVIRSLINDGSLTQGEDGRWHFSETITSITVPDTLEGVLLARLDRLEELCRWTVQVASVIGRSFPYDVVAHTATAVNPVPINEYLTHLQLVEIIREGQRNPELVYAFIHTLMQEVSYSSLAASARRQYHRLIAQFLEDHRSRGWGRTESLPTLIAHHAYEGEDWPRALKYQMETGQQAQGLFANQEAIDHFRKALSSAEQLPADETEPARLSIHLALSQLYIDTGQYEDAFTHLTKAHTIAMIRQDETALITVCHWHARLYELRGEYPQALEWIEQGLTIPSQTNTAEYAHLLILAGLINLRQGNYEDALTFCQQVLEIAEPLGQVTVVARAHILLGYLYWRGGNTNAIDYFQKAFDLYHQVGHIQGQVHSHNMIANACFSLGRWAEAEYHYLQAHSMSDQIGNKYDLAVADNNLGGIALKRGQFENALLFYQEGLKLARLVGSAWMLGVFHMNLGWTYTHLGDIKQAKENLAASQTHFEQAQSREFLPELKRHQAEAALLADELDLAAQHIQESLRLAQELDMRGEQGTSMLVWGRIAYAQGDLATAQERLQASVAILQEVAEEYELARSHYWLAVILVELGKIEPARPLLAEAAHTFKRLDVSHDLTAVTTLQAQLDTTHEL